MLIYIVYRGKNQHFDENDGSTVGGFVVDVIMEKIETTFFFKYFYPAANKTTKKTIIILSHQQAKPGLGGENRT